MNKTWKTVITLLLVLTMLFGVCSTTIAAADSGGGDTSDTGSSSTGGGTSDAGDTTDEGEDEDPVIDSVKTGWCDVEYTENGIVVTLTPDLDAIKAVDVEMIKELATVLIEAVRKVVVDDMLEHFEAGDVSISGGSFEIGGINADNVWVKALDGYVNANYSVEDDTLSDREKEEAAYVNFLSTVLEDNGAVDNLADYICSIVKAAVVSGVINKEDLPDSKNLEKKLIDQFEDYLDGFIKSHVAEIIDDFVEHIHDSTGADYDGLSTMDKYVEVFIGELIEDEIERYVLQLDDSSFVLTETDKMVFDSACSFLGKKVSAVMEEYADYLVDNTKGFGTDAVHNYVRAYFDASVEDAVDAYLAGNTAGLNTLGQQVVAYILSDAAVKALVDAYSAAVTAQPSLKEEHLAVLVEDITVYFNTSTAGAATSETILESILSALDMAKVLDECLEGYNEAEIEAFIDVAHSYLADKNELHKLIIEVVAKLESEADGEGTKLDKFLDDVCDEVVREAHAEDNTDPDTALNSVVKEVLGIDITIGEVYERIDDVAVSVARHYLDVVGALDSVGKVEAVLELLKLINDISIDGHSIVSVTDAGLNFSVEAVIALLKDIPTFSEIAEMDAEDMFLSYDVGIYTDFGNSEFNLTLKLGGGYEKVKKIAAIIDRNLSVTRDSNGKIYVNVTVPDEFARALLKACTSSRIPDSLKSKLFAAISYNSDDAMAIINDITLDDLLAILDKLDGKVDFDGILDKEFISQFERLDGLTYDQIRAKIKEYERYYEKAISILNRVYGYVPESLTDKTLFNLYDGEGKFSVEADNVTVDLYKMSYKALCKVTTAEKAEKFSNLLASVLDKTSVTVSGYASVQFASINKIEYYVGDELVRAGFLPKGADLKFFAGITEHNGNYITTWLDESGTPITEMPDRDTKLTAKLQKIEVEITSNYTVTDGKISIVYGDTPVTLTATLKSATVAGTAFNYVWYKQTGVNTWDKVFEGSDKTSVTFANHADSGIYRVEVSATYGGYTEVSISGEINVTIAKKQVNLVTDLLAADNRWTAGPVYEYDGTEHSVAVDGFTIPSTVTLEEITGDLKATSAKDGSYVVTARFALKDSDNYEFVGAVSSYGYEWSITPRLVSGEILNVTESHTNGEAVYLLGASHTISVALADGTACGKRYDEIFSIELSDDSDELTQVNAGTYYVYVDVTLLDTNYKLDGGLRIAKSWTVAKQPIDLSVFEWSYDEEKGLSYNATEQSVELLGLPADMEKVVSYTNASGTDATTEFQVASAYFDSSKEGYNEVMNNYAMTSAFKELTWGIKKRVITAENAEWVVDTEYSYDVDEESGKFIFTYAPDFEYMFSLVGIPELEHDDVLEYKYYYKPRTSTVRLASRANSGWIEWDGVNPPTDAGEYKVDIVVHHAHTGNYEISDEIAKSFEYTIKKQVIDLDANKITLDNVSIPYTGNLITVNTVIPAELKEYIDAGVIVLSTNGSQFSATDVGGNTVLIGLSLASAHANNYEVTGTERYELHWGIIEKDIVTALDDVTLDKSGVIGEYTGNVQSVSVKYSDYIQQLVNDGIITATVLAESELSGTNAKDYTVKVKLKVVTSNYLIDGSTEKIITLGWSISKKVVNIPDLEFSYKKEHNWTGEAITIVITANAKNAGEVFDTSVFKITYSGNTETDVGPHTATAVVSLKDENNFAMGTGTKSYSLDWEIIKTVTPLRELNLGDISWKETTTVYTYNGQTQVYDGGLVIPQNSDKVTVIYYVNGVKCTDGIKAKNAGTYTITFEFSYDETEYPGGIKYSISSNSKDWTVAKKQLVFDNLSWNTYNSFIYEANTVRTYAGIAGVPAEYKDVIDIDYDGDISATEIGEYQVRLLSIKVKSTWEEASNYYTDVNYTIVQPSTVWYITDSTTPLPTINVGELSWSSTDGFKYNGEEQFYGGLIIPEQYKDALDYIEILYKVNGGEPTTKIPATNAGTYTVEFYGFRFKDGYENQFSAVIEHSFKNDQRSIDWVIEKATLDIGELTWSGNLTYTGNEQTFGGLVIEEKYKDLIEVEYSGNKAATEIGKYKITLVGITISAQASGNYASVVYTIKNDATEYEWKIRGNLVIETPLEWSTEFPVYNGTEQRYAGIVIPEEYLKYFDSITYRYTGKESAVDAGKYEITLGSITFVLKEEYADLFLEVEYSIKDSAISYEWQIKKAELNIGNATLKDKIVAVNGKPHKITLSGTLPEGITVTYTAQKDGAAADYEALTELGVYVITATLEGGSNYEVKTLTANLTIAEKQQYISENVIVIAGIRLPDDYKMKENNVIGNYTAIDFSALAGEGKIATLVKAYDVIFYVTDGDVSLADGEFVVKILLDSALKAEGTVLKVVYIAADGSFEEIEATVEGDYAVFNTTHFSVYGIVQITEPDTPDEPTPPTPPDEPDKPDKDLTWLWILLIIIIILLIIIIILIILKKRGDKEEPTEDKEPEPTPEPEVEAEEEKTEEPVVEEPVVEEPVVEEPVVEEPVVEEPVVEEPVVEEPKAEEPPVIIPFAVSGDDSEGRRLVNGVIVPIRYRTSFMSRLIQSEPPIQDYYTVVKNYLLSYKGVKARTSWNFESFNKGRIQCAKLNVKGSAFLVYLALDPKEYNESKYHFTDVSDKPKLGDVPMMLKVKSDRALKYALELITEMMNKLGIEQGEIPTVDYHMPYESTDDLADRDLVKIILPAGMVIDENTIIEKVNVGDLLKDFKDDDADASDEPEIEEPVVEEPVDAALAVAPTTVEVRYRRSFMSRLIQSEDDLKSYYSEIKNELLSYKGVKARTSWSKETFRKARIPVARMDVKGKMLYLFLALDPKEIEDSKYRFKDVSAKRGGAEYPTLLKVRSARGKNHAIELIRLLMSKLELERIERENENFVLPYEETDALVERGLIKVILPKGAVIDENTVTVKISIPDFERSEKTEVAAAPVAEAALDKMVEEAPVEHHEVHIVDHHILEEEIVHVDAEHVDEFISDEQAKEFIETITHAPGFKPKSSKRYEINLDIICENFEDDDVVTIEALKSKKLISKKAERIKVLARGTMTKKLTVIADNYSMQAVKMIGLAGGLAEKYKD